METFGSARHDGSCQFKLISIWHVVGCGVVLWFPTMIPHLASGILIIIFLITGLGKVLAPHLLRVELGHLTFLPSYMSWFLAGWLPWLELSCSVGLMIGTWRRGAATTALMLSLVFFIASLNGWIFGWSTACSCLGMLSIGWSGIPWSLHVLIALVMIILSLVTLVGFDETKK
jgi:uncharacterized membrane protein YphA (DoxX/SURF4 family)